MSIHILLDNADTSLWEEWSSSGLFHGITTNPTLLKQANQACEINNLETLAQKAEELGFQELHLQAWGKSLEELEMCAFLISEIKLSSLQIHVKIPITLSGSQVAQKLIAARNSITLTACYEPKQVLIADALQATYIAPYLGRINDQGEDGLSKLVVMQKCLIGLKSSCKLLVASLRSLSEIIYLAKEGVDTFTINPSLAKDMYDVPKTIEAVRVFENDSRHIQQ